MPELLQRLLNGAKVLKNALPWYVQLGIELVRVLPDVIRAVKADPNPDNKESVKTVSKNIREGIGSPPGLKNL